MVGTKLDLLFHDEGKAKVEATASDSEFISYDDLLTNILYLRINF
jgi:hypothetical protein